MDSRTSSAAAINLQSAEGPYSGHGRVGRLAYLARLLCVSGLMGGAAVLLAYRFYPMGLLSWPALWLTYCALIVTLSFKRCHDVGINGWWSLLILVLGPLVVLALLIVPGSPADNRYGPRSKLAFADGAWPKVLLLFGLLVSAAAAFFWWAARSSYY